MNQRNARIGGGTGNSEMHPLLRHVIVASISGLVAGFLVVGFEAILGQMSSGRFASILQLAAVSAIFIGVFGWRLSKYMWQIAVGASLLFMFYWLSSKIVAAGINDVMPFWIKVLFLVHFPIGVLISIGVYLLALKLLDSQTP